MWRLLVPEAKASVGASAIAGVVGEVNRAETTPDRLVLDRIARERERSIAHYLRVRDASRLEQSMARLDPKTSGGRDPRAIGRHPSRHRGPLFPRPARDVEED